MINLTRRSKLYLAVALFGLLVVFGPTLRQGYILLDDDAHLYANAKMQSPSIENVLEYWKAPFFGLYIPVTYSLWAVESTFARNHHPAPGDYLLNPNIFHFGNWILHAANGFLVFLILQLLTAETTAAFLGALLFLFHPVQVETVAWLSQRRDLLSMFFGSLSIFLLLRGSRGDHAFWRKSFIVASVCYVLALLSKPSTVVLPVLASILLWGWENRDPKWLLKWFTPWFLAAIPVAWVTFSVQKTAVTGYVSPWWFRPVVAGDALSFYGFHLLFPSSLAIDYARGPRWLMESGAGYLTFWIPLVVIALAFWKRASRKTASVGLLFVASLLPVLGFAPFAYQQFSTVSDHYLYLPMLAVALGAAWLLTKIQNPKAPQIAAILIAVLGIRSAFYVAKWSDSEKIFSHTLTLYPRSQAASNNLGFLREKQNRLEEAVALYQMALRERPEWTDIRFNVANIQAKLNRFGEAMANLEPILKNTPNHADSQYLYGGVLFAQGHPQEALPYLEKAVALLPTKDFYYVKLGAVLTQLNRNKEAIEKYATALKMNPAMPDAYNNLGVTYEHIGDMSSARVAFERSVQLDPNYLQARRNLAGLLQGAKEYEKAAEQLQAILAKSPGEVHMRLVLATCLKKMGKIDEALAQMKIVVEQDPSRADVQKEIQTLSRGLASKRKS